MIRKYRAVRASSKIASAFKMHMERQQFKSTVRAIIRIQSQQRVVASKLVAKKLRDPFYGISRKELAELLRREKKNIDNAVKSKDFAAAAASEVKV
jgi:hypothetical protein